MDITPQFIKNMLHSTFRTRVENPDEISSPVVSAIQSHTEALKSSEATKGISKPIVSALVDLMSKYDKSEERRIEAEKSGLVVSNIEEAKVDISEAVEILKAIRDKEEREVVIPEYPAFPEQKEVDLSPVIKALEKIAKLIPKLTKEEKLDYTSNFSEILEEIKRDKSKEWEPILKCLEKIEEKELPLFEIPQELIKDGRILVNVDKVGGGGPSNVYLKNGDGTVTINPATEEGQASIVDAIEGITIPAPVGGATEATLEEVKVNTDVLGAETDTSKDNTQDGTLSARLRYISQKVAEVANSTSDLFNITNGTLIPSISSIQGYIEGLYNKFFPEYAKIVDGNTDPGTFYIGIAPIGSATTDPVWQAQKAETSGDNVIITWADGNSNFDNQFDAPNTLSYS